MPGFGPGITTLATFLGTVPLATVIEPLGPPVAPLSLELEAERDTEEEDIQALPS